MGRDIESLEQNPGACLVCGFKGHDEYAVFCQHCGHEMQPENFCTNRHCVKNHDEDNPIPCRKNARYCPDCGEPTILKEDGRFDEPSA